MQDETVFPTHVGMNRWRTTGKGLPVRVPHARGDEPPMLMSFTLRVGVFPTHVGMNQLEGG